MQYSILAGKHVAQAGCSQTEVICIWLLQVYIATHQSQVRRVWPIEQLLVESLIVS